MIVECVPNFSEGRDPLIINGIARAIAETPRVRLLDRTSDPDHHRSVFTFAGAPDGVAAAAVDAVRVAVATIDISQHAGVHPRVGSADVVPFIPVDQICLQQCVTIARGVAGRIWRELGVPVFLADTAAPCGLSACGWKMCAGCRARGWNRISGMGVILLPARAWWARGGF